MFRRLLALLLIACAACSSDEKDLIELELDPPERQQINRDIVGVNDFFNHPQFGGIDAQYSEIRNTLGLRFVRVLFSWTDGSQPTPDSSLNIGFFDDIINSIPNGVDILIVVAHTPSWMANAANWPDGNPRNAWVDRWLQPLVQRYAGNPRVIGWEIWNEPDFTVVASDGALGLTAPENYVELLRRGSAVVRQNDPGKLVVMAATRSIQQNFPETLDYNRRLRDLGAGELTDVWNVHYYGEQFENVIRDGGVRDFLNGLSKPIWITESGEQGPNNQLAFAETVWPFLAENIQNIQRIYYFEFASPAPLSENFGLKTTDPNFPVSDLYIHLRDG